jgi:hypothetical protein
VAADGAGEPNFAERRRLTTLAPLPALDNTTENTMASYMFAQYLSHVNNSALDVLYHPGAATPFSGIYRCEVCGTEAVSVAPHPLPPQNHHVHLFGAGPIQWRLIVASTHR